VAAILRTVAVRGHRHGFLALCIGHAQTLQYAALAPLNRILMSSLVPATLYPRTPAPRVPAIIRPKHRYIYNCSTTLCSCRFVDRFIVERIDGDLLLKLDRDMLAEMGLTDGASLSKFFKSTDKLRGHSEDAVNKLQTMFCTSIYAAWRLIRLAPACPVCVFLHLGLLSLDM